MPTALVISFTDLSRDPRVRRQIRQLEAAYAVVSAGTGEPSGAGEGHVPLEPLFAGRLDRALFIPRLLSRAHDRTYWSRPAIRAARSALTGVEADLVVANELESLPLALSLGRPVLFDAHEYSPGEYEDSLRWRMTWGPYVRDLCRRYIPQVRGMTTVGHAIAERYETDTGVRCDVVMNAPAFVDIEPTPVGDTIRMLHYGGADRSRRLERMIELMGHLDDRFTLDLVLVGGAARYLSRLRRLAGADQRIRFLEPVPMDRLIEFASGYDVGLYLLDPGAFNRLHALPNKFFEFVQARLALAIGPSPEMARLAREWDLGVVSADFEPSSLAAALARLDAEDVMHHKRRAAAAARELNAAREGERLLAAAEAARRGAAAGSG